MDKEAITQKAITDAWDFYISQHDVTVGFLIKDAVTEATEGVVRKWFEQNGAELLERVMRSEMASWLKSSGGQDEERALGPSPADVLAETCPLCGATSGEPCGSWMGDRPVHRARWTEALDRYFTDRGHDDV